MLSGFFIQAYRLSAFPAINKTLNVKYFTGSFSSFYSKNGGR